MKRFKNLLVHVGHDGDVAVDRALEIARESQARATLVHVVEDLPRLLGKVFASLEDLHGVMISEWEDRLEEAAAPLRAAGLEVDTKVLSGKTWLELVREVLRSEHDMVLKSASRPSDGDELDGAPFFGSGDMHLMRKSPAAVWMVNPKSPPAMKILATVDPTPEGRALNEQILEMAGSLAELRGGELHVLHAWRPLAENLLHSRMPEEDFVRYLEEAQQAARDAMDALLKHLKSPLPTQSVRVVKGDAGLVIPKYVQQYGIGLVVMGTVARTGISGLLMGNTAENILNRVRCSVLAVKPEGFVTPVTPD